VTQLDPEVRDLLAALRDALLDPTTNRFMVLGLLDALVDGKGTPADAVVLLGQLSNKAVPHP
jgi:hypothetical protein